MDSSTLYDAIVEAGCPTISTSVGDPDVRATWSFRPADNATQAQIDIGNNVIATIPIEALATAVTAAEFIGRFTNAEYRAVTAAAWRGSAGNAKNFDVVVFDPVINMNKKKTKTLRDSLVADGILTAQRANEIFS